MAHLLGPLKLSLDTWLMVPSFHLFIFRLSSFVFPTGIRRSRTRSRAGNGSCGLLVNTKGADGGSTIIRRVPFRPQCIRPEVVQGAYKQRMRGLQGLAPVWVQAKKDVQQYREDLRAMRSAVHGICAAASGDGQRPTPMEQDSDNFKHKIEQLSLSAKRARADSNADRAALIACVDGLVAEASLLFKKRNDDCQCPGGRAISVFDNESCPYEDENSARKETNCRSQH